MVINVGVQNDGIISGAFSMMIFFASRYSGAFVEWLLGKCMIDGWTDRWMDGWEFQYTDKVQLYNRYVP
ncbi:hypothetical protein BCR42DRAFT_412886 [Absidia repens]|uniref:Uncharacterized protein n=1 Tax=Absidia repens TaxID=90262 RepID=A0A1X2IKA0_9FUNG|nr:hypothetical protein BCR42DRAFT_412886 [Absidia repens]